MSLDKNISNKIKSSFESENHHAPKDFWSKLNKSLDNKNIDSKIKLSFEEQQIKAPLFNFEAILEKRTPIDEKISKSFEEQSNVLPNSVWENVQNSLDINQVWNGLSGQIKISTFSWTKLAVASLIIGFISLFPPTQLKNPISTNLVTTQIYFSAETTNDGNLYLAQNLAKNSIHSKKNYKVNQQEVISNTLLITEPHTLVSINIRPTAQTEQEPTIGNKVDQEKNDEIALLHVPLHILDNNNVHTKTQPSEISMPNKKTTNRVRVGIIGSIDNTWINNDDMRESFNKNSLLTSKLSFGISSGVTADYYFNENIGITANYLFQSSSKNKIGFYDNGFYKIKTTEINYTKGSILFNYAKPIRSKKSAVKYIFSVGPYLAYNKNSIMTSGQTITSFNTSYKKLDYGLKLQIGKEHQWSNIVLAYGVNSDTGLRNIIDNQNYSSAELNLTTNFNVGLFTSLKYEF